MIPLDDLQHGAWYYGLGRLGPVAKWDSTHFVSVTTHQLSCRVRKHTLEQHSIGFMEYNSGFAPYGVIDTSFTPDVLFQVDMAMKGRYERLPEKLSLQNRAVIEEFFHEFMEVGTYYLNVETQKELLKVAMTRIAVTGNLSAEEMRKLATETLNEVNHMILSNKR